MAAPLGRSRGALAPALLGLLLLACGDDARRRDVLLITIDTLRADFVHAYGFPYESTPRIDALAARGFLFERAVAAAPATAPSHASIMTARFAHQHSIGTANGHTRLEGHATLAGTLQGAGYETAAFVSNVVLRRRTGLDHGFDHYDDELVAGEPNRPAHFERVAGQTVERALEWLAARGRRPFFLWVHLQDPHGPYTPPEGFAGRIGEVPLPLARPLPVLDANAGRGGIPAYQRLDELRSPAAYAGRYAEEILYVDEQVGRLVDAFVARSDADGVVLLTADHGESLGEGGWFFQHGQATTPELAFVPLLVVGPGVRPGRSDALVSHVDVAPTLLELAGVESLLGGSGLSLLPLIRAGTPLPERPVFCDGDGESAVYSEAGYARVQLPPAAGPAADPDAALRFEAARRGPGRAWRRGEPSERERAELRRHLANRAPRVPAPAMAPEHLEQLRALGYLPPLEATEDGAGEHSARQ